MNCFDDLVVPTDMVQFSIQFLFVQSMPHYRSDSRLWIQQVCAFTHRLLAALRVPPSLLPPLSISVSMADWMSQMVNAVDEAEAANALPQEEVPTEPATSPRSQMIEVPINDGRWTAEEYAQLLWYIAQDLNAHDQALLQLLLDRQHAQAKPKQLPDMEKERRRVRSCRA